MSTQSRRAVPLGLLVAATLAACASPPTGPGAADEQIVRVLPFEVRGQEEGAEYVGKSLAESLAAALTQAENLRLAAEETGDDAPASALVATRRVTGTLNREADADRVSVQIRDPVSDVVLWETEVSSDSGSLSELASRVARRTIEALEVPYPDLYGSMDDIRGGPEMSESPLWSDARNWRTHDAETRRRSSSALVDRFSDDPAAHVLDAWALVLSWDASPATETYLVRLKERLDALDRVDPASPYDELMRGYIYRSSGEPNQAREMYSRVLQRTTLTNAARAWALRQRSLAVLQIGDAASARRDAEEAVGLDPSNALSLVALSKSLEAAGELESAITASRQALTLEPLQWRHHQRLGLVLARAGRFDAAALSVERACRLSESQEACSNLAVSFQLAGREAEARAAAEHAESLPGTPWGLYNLACYRARAGQKSAAIDNLGRSVELGFADILITTDRDLDSLRSDPAFDAIVNEVEDRLSVRRELSGSVFPWQAWLLRKSTPTLV